MMAIMNVHMRVLALVIMLVGCNYASGKTIDQIIKDASANRGRSAVADIGDNVLTELDILYPKEEWEARKLGGASSRKAAPDRRWTNNVVPYTVVDAFSDEEMRIIQAAFHEYHKYTCLSFREKVDSDATYIKIIDGEGCNSYVGMYGWSSGQTVSLGFGCLYLGTVIHELGHAIGFQHEQCRPDRDNYVTINKENILSDYTFAFNKINDINTYGLKYDYTSIMHYGAKAFSFNYIEPTITTKDPAMQDVIGEGKLLSFLDIKLANLMYKCSEGCDDVTCPAEGFLGKDCKCWCPGNPVKLCSGDKKVLECIHKDEIGRRYAGTVSKTVNGRACQAWRKQFPHKHDQGTREANFPEGNLAYASNYCRNPDGEPGPWCYTTDPGKRWELCDIKICKECINDVTGRGYSGTKAVARGGLVCQAWSSQYPNPHPFGQFADEFPEGNLEDAKNYCRKPFESISSALMCVTIDYMRALEYCDVQLCSEALCRKDQRGEGYSGAKNLTKDGLECQAWVSQSPHRHDYVVYADKFPEGNLKDAKNYCRNPGGRGNEPWCYTTDTEKLWEYCDVPMC